MGYDLTVNFSKHNFLSFKVFIGSQMAVVAHTVGVLQLGQLKTKLKLDSTVIYISLFLVA